METKKLTEGALFSALQVVLGIFLISTGIGYSVYIQVVFPVIMTVICLRCGIKAGTISGLNAIMIIGCFFGDVVGAVYLVQSLGFGLICGLLIRRKSGLQDDLIVASLVGCVFLLVLDVLTAQVVGVSLLDREGMEIFYEWVPDGTEELFEVFFYMTIASVPIASVLMSYVGGLLLGHRLGLLSGEAINKYEVIRYFKVMFPHSYHSKKVINGAICGIAGCMLLWPVAEGAYIKALIAVSGMIMMYFVLTDFVKLIAQYLVDKGRSPAIVSMMHLGMLFCLFSAFKAASSLVIIVGYLIDMKAPTRRRQEQILRFYLLESRKSKRDLSYKI